MKHYWILNSLLLWNDLLFNKICILNQSFYTPSKLNPFQWEPYISDVMLGHSAVSVACGQAGGGF